MLLDNVDPIVNKNTPVQIPVAKPYIGRRERDIVATVMESGWLTQGKYCQLFEEEFAGAHGCKPGVSCNSGTTALILALRAAGVGPGDIVACPTMTMVACPNAILALGATPRFYDCDNDGNVLWQEMLEQPRFLSSRIRTAIIVHLYGVPCEFDPARFRDAWIRVVEDCAEAHYARFLKGDFVGSRGDFATFSFYANKIITTGEGGMVFASFDEDIKRLRQLRSHAFTPGNHFNHQEWAFGFRMTDIQAAIGVVQNSWRKEFISTRLSLARRYHLRIGDGNSEKFWSREPKNRDAANWVMPLECKTPKIARAVRFKLAENGVETRTFFRPMHMQPHLREYAAGCQFPKAEDLFERCIYLPLFPDMTDYHVDYICDVLQTV